MPNKFYPWTCRYKRHFIPQTDADPDSTAEVIRHQHHVTPMTSLPVALAQEIKMALRGEEWSTSFRINQEDKLKLVSMYVVCIHDIA